MLLNLSRMEEGLSARLGLDAKKIKMFTGKVEEFFGILENKIESTEGVEILEILSILTSFKENFASEAEWENLVYRSLEILRQDLYASIFDSIFAYSGLTQVALVINNLCKKIPDLKPFLSSVNNILAENIDEYIKDSSMPEFFTKNNFEFIYGLSGTLRHALDFNKDDRLRDAATKMVEILIRRSNDKDMLGHTIMGWHYYPSPTESKYMAEPAENGLVNYGLSHGIGGPLMALSLAYNKGIRVDGLKEAIDGLFDEYDKAAYRVNDIIHWPGRITFEQYIGQDEIIRTPSQMSWCYGSIGILRAMYLASIYTSNKEKEIFAVDELIKIAKMKTNDYLLHMPIVCHGFAGTVSIMDEMFADIQNNVFFDAARNQMMACVDYIINADYAYIDPKRERRVHLFSYLEGYSGILQTIQSLIGKGDNGHKKHILIV